MTVRSAVNDCCHIELVGAVTTGSEPAVPMAIAHVHGRFPADAEIDHAERRNRPNRLRLGPARYSATYPDLWANIPVGPRR